jgi:hypothetical protein
MAWELWLLGRVQLSEFDRLSIDDIESASRANEAWQDAERRLAARNKPQNGKR